ncbi:hypothetical protein [Fibrobacter sp. UWB12]|uniref:hypothetical protein n=1 Tax=Fibrobacter sp. UWB12 TaxID=1896203 RepID=UPI00092135E2|nr:hypothetical protein [Fibrobacter sp. UWB12]SHK99882.1 hypothetical protein SAMN05720759_11218 [Fibrobacter sp. UWB12]
MRIKFSLFVLCSVILLSFVACTTNENAEARSPVGLARNYLSINATEDPILYEEKYLPFYDYIARDSADGKIEDFTTMYNVDSLEKLCLRDKNSYCRQIFLTNDSIAFVPFYLPNYSKKDEKDSFVTVVIVNKKQQCVHGEMLNYRKMGVGNASYRACRSPEMINDEKVAKVQMYVLIAVLCLGACYLLFSLTKKLIAFIKKGDRFESLNQNLRSFLKRKKDSFEQNIPKNEIKIKTFITVFFAFLLLGYYLFCGSGHEDSITNRYPIFCKSPYNKSYFDHSRACKIDGNVLYTEMDSLDVPFLHLFVLDSYGIYETHHLKCVNKNGEDVTILTYKEDYVWGMRERNPVRFWIKETADSVKIFYDPEPVGGFIVENNPFSKNFVIEKQNMNDIK